MSLHRTASRSGFRPWRRRSRSEARVYGDTPRVGWATWNYFSRGRVEKVTIGPPAGGRPEGSP